MTTNFPTSVDSFPDPLATDRLDNPPHDVLHTNVNSAVEAIETALLDGAPLHIDDANERVGIGTSTPESTLEVNGILTANHIHGNIAGAVYLHVKNTSGVTIPKGSPVYATGSVGASGATEVAISAADDASTMPALGVVDAELVANAEGHATVLGVAKGLDTSAWSVNDSLYVSEYGDLTNVRPTHPSALVQKIGRVIRADASTGEVLVLGAGRANDVPNGLSPTITLTGDASGSVTLTELSSGTLSVTVADDSHNHIISNVDGLQTALDGKLSTTGTAADSSKLGGLSLSAGSSAPSGSQVIRSHTNGYTYLGWINTVSGATTSTIDRIYASNDAFVRYVTPATFRSQIINGQAISPSSVTASGDINANGNIYVGKNGGGDSNIFFYDDNTNTRRTFQWDDSANDWRVEDNGATMRTLWHSGNSYGLAVAATTVSATSSYAWYLLNMPSGVSIYNLVSISPVEGVNNTLYISEIALGNWATVQTATQIYILCRLGNGVHTEPYYINFYYKKDY